MDVLRGMKVLVVEDEHLIAMALCDELQDCGAMVVGPVSSVEKALAVIASHLPAAAVLDFDLRGEQVTPVVDLLLRLAIPFILTTGYDASALPSRYRDMSICMKPATALQVVEVLCAALRIQAEG